MVRQATPRDCDCETESTLQPTLVLYPIFLKALNYRHPVLFDYGSRRLSYCDCDTVRTHARRRATNNEQPRTPESYIHTVPTARRFVAPTFWSLSFPVNDGDRRRRGPLPRASIPTPISTFPTRVVPHGHVSLKSFAWSEQRVGSAESTASFRSAFGRSLRRLDPYIQ